VLSTTKISEKHQRIIRQLPVACCPRLVEIDPHPLDYPARVRSDSTIARISRFSKTEFPGSPFPRTTTSTIARAKLSARITWFGKSARNAG